MKFIHNLLAFLFFALGAIGAFLPVLPTVPFLLLASFFFSKGSERFNKWFTNTKIYKKHLEDFIENKEMTLRRKLSITIPVSIMLLIVFFKSNNLHLRIGLILILIFKDLYFIFRIKTVKAPSKSRE